MFTEWRRGASYLRLKRLVPECQAPERGVLFFQPAMSGGSILRLKQVKIEIEVKAGIERHSRGSGNLIEVKIFLFDPR